MSVPTDNGAGSNRERVIVVSDAAVARGDDVDLANLVRTLWQGRWWIVAITSVIVAVTVVYALTARQWYRADVVLVVAARPDAPTSNLTSQLGGLASIAGIARRNNSAAEPLAVLRSREFVGQFIEDGELLPVLASAQPFWVSPELMESDLREGVQFFNDYVLRSTEDIDTGLVTVTIEWVDPQLAAEWANALISRLNTRMRERALRENELNISYLKRELAEANQVTLQQTVGRVLESELQKGMMARVNEEFAFKVIDPAEPPKYRVRPRRTQVVLFSAFAGLLFSSVIVLLRAAIKRAGIDQRAENLAVPPRRS